MPLGLGVEVWCPDLILKGEVGRRWGSRASHLLQTELLPRCGEIESVGKVVQEDGRMLLIAVLEVSWSKWWAGVWGDLHC